MGRTRAFFVDALPDSGTVKLDAAQAHHLSTVLRLATGAEVIAFDAAGNARHAEVERIDRHGVLLKILRDVARAPASPLSISLYQSVLRSRAMEKVIVMASELGARAVIPLVTARTRTKTVGPERLKRWRRLAVESSKQCGRTGLLDVGDPQAFDRLALAERDGVKIIFAPGTAQALSEAGIQRSLHVHLLVGPEGGWESAEMRAALDSGCHAVGLGPRILRAETASVSVLAIIQHLWGDLSSIP